MAGRPATNFRSGDAVFAFDSDLLIVSWNRAAEELTGVSADEAVGRHCWEVLGGHDDCGDLVCHRGCSTARLARENWPIACQRLLIEAPEGMRRVRVSTVAVDDGDSRLFLHVLVPNEGRSRPASRLLTMRQEEVLRLLADGLPAKVIATQLGVVEVTVRNHIRAILVALGAHSQLEAIAKARRFEIIDTCPCDAGGNNGRGTDRDETTSGWPRRGRGRRIATDPLMSDRSPQRRHDRGLPCRDPYQCPKVAVGQHDRAPRW
jgi:PAS domain S-box-containing protein